MRGLNLTIAAALALATSAATLAQAPSPNCQGLVAQLAALDRGDTDPGRNDQIRRAEDAVHRQQYEVDRMVSQARQMGCERSGFFSIFSNPPPQCGNLNRQIDQARNSLDRLQMQLEQSQGARHSSDWKPARPLHFVDVRWLVAQEPQQLCLGRIAWDYLAKFQLLVGCGHSQIQLFQYILSASDQLRLALRNQLIRPSMGRSVDATGHREDFSVLIDGHASRD